MKRLVYGFGVAVVGLTLSLGAPMADGETCRPDAVRSGDLCMDKFEASVWQTTNGKLISRIRRGRVTLSQLTAGGAIQHGISTDDYGFGCPDTGNGCVNFYAVSIPGVMPSSFLTWFQAAAAARNSGKRLPSNAEWQAAALGTPDPGVSGAGSEDCNTANGGGAGVNAVVPSGSRDNCVSDVGAFDLVGNLSEWVADWVPLSTTCVPPLPFAVPGPVDDFNCLAGASETSGPGALRRGGDFTLGELAGVFAVNGFSGPADAASAFIPFGFRAAR